MVTDNEFYQSASVLIQQHGKEGALEHIHNRLEAMEADGDKAGYVAWMAIFRAYARLIRQVPLATETVQ